MTLIIETAPGVKFTNHAKEFNKGGYAGFVRKGKNGMLFMDADKQPKAFLSKYDGGFFVTAFKSEADGGRTRYMYGLSDASRDFIGLSDATYTAETQRANEMVRQHYLWSARERQQWLAHDAMAQRPVRPERARLMREHDGSCKNTLQDKNDGHASLSISSAHGWPAVGFAVITEETMQKHGYAVEPESYQSEIQRHINLLNQAASGYVYGFVIRDSEWLEVDACWNFVGDNPIESGMLEQVPEELHPQIWKAFEDGQIETAPAQ